MNIHIETKRLIIRDIEQYDVKGIFELDSDPEVHRFLGNRPVTTIKEVEEDIEYMRSHYSKHGMGRWAIVDKTTNKFMGWAGIKYEEEIREYGYYDIGYRLIKKFWGQGIATEAATGLLEFGFETKSLNKICAETHIENTGSSRVLQKIGLKFIETFNYAGEILNWYEIEKSEWIKKKTTANKMQTPFALYGRTEFAQNVSSIRKKNGGTRIPQIFK